jgi:hypothetical protein
MKKRSLKHDEGYENFLNEMDEMTEEEFEEKLQRAKDFARRHHSDKDMERIAKGLHDGLKYLKNCGAKNAGKTKKTARRAKAISKKLLKEARNASKLAD